MKERRSGLCTIYPIRAFTRLGATKLLSILPIRRLVERIGSEFLYCTDVVFRFDLMDEIDYPMLRLFEIIRAGDDKTILDSSYDPEEAIEELIKLYFFIHEGAYYPNQFFFESSRINSELFELREDMSSENDDIRVYQLLVSQYAETVSHIRTVFRETLQEIIKGGLEKKFKKKLRKKLRKNFEPGAIFLKPPVLILDHDGVKEELLVNQGFQEPELVFHMVTNSFEWTPDWEISWQRGEKDFIEKAQSLINGQSKYIFYDGPHANIISYHEGCFYLLDSMFGFDGLKTLEEREKNSYRLVQLQLKALIHSFEKKIILGSKARQQHIYNCKNFAIYDLMQLRAFPYLYLEMAKNQFNPDLVEHNSKVDLYFFQALLYGSRLYLEAQPQGEEYLGMANRKVSSYLGEVKRNVDSYLDMAESQANPFGVRFSEWPEKFLLTSSGSLTGSLKTDSLEVVLDIDGKISTLKNIIKCQLSEGYRGKNLSYGYNNNQLRYSCSIWYTPMRSLESICNTPAVGRESLDRSILEGFLGPLLLFGINPMAKALVQSFINELNFPNKINNLVYEYLAPRSPRAELPLQANGHGFYHAASMSVEDIDPLVLHNRVVDQVVLYPEMYVRFVPATINLDDFMVERISDISWADNIMMQAAVCVLNRPIKVHRFDRNAGNPNGDFLKISFPEDQVVTGSDQVVVCFNQSTYTINKKDGASAEESKVSSSVSSSSSSATASLFLEQHVDGGFEEGDGNHTTSASSESSSAHDSDTVAELSSSSNSPGDGDGGGGGAVGSVGLNNAEMTVMQSILANDQFIVIASRIVSGQASQSEVASSEIEALFKALYQINDLPESIQQQLLSSGNLQKVFRLVEEALRFYKQDTSYLMREPVFIENQDITDDTIEYAQVSVMDSPYATVDTKCTDLIGSNSLIAATIS